MVRRLLIYGMGQTHSLGARTLRRVFSIVRAPARIDFETLRGSYKTTRLNDHTLTACDSHLYVRGRRTGCPCTRIVAVSLRFLMCAPTLCVLSSSSAGNCWLLCGFDVAWICNGDSNLHVSLACKFYVWVFLAPFKRQDWKECFE